MAIQIVNLAVPNGDTPRSANTKINENFSNQTHAASRLVGKLPSNIAEITNYGVADTGLGGAIKHNTEATNAELITALISKGSCFFRSDSSPSAVTSYGTGFFAKSQDTYAGLTISYDGSAVRAFTSVLSEAATPKIINFLTDKNTVIDSSGFIKKASPVVNLHSDYIELNGDATEQGGITFEKLNVGNYLIKGSLGFAQEGWYIETPKDANGNVLVAVVYEQLENNDLSIKTYAKKFDDETGDIVANLLKPRDIPAGRFISLRLHELPKEPPVMPTED